MVWLDSEGNAWYGLIGGMVGWETDTWYPDRRIGDGLPGIDQGTSYHALLLLCARVGWWDDDQDTGCNLSSTGLMRSIGEGGGRWAPGNSSPDSVGPPSTPPASSIGTLNHSSNSEIILMLVWEPLTLSYCCTLRILTFSNYYHHCLHFRLIIVMEALVQAVGLNISQYHHHHHIHHNYHHHNDHRSCHPGSGFH